LTDNLARRRYEFSDDRLVVKSRTLTLEAETEIRYRDIKVIRTSRNPTFQLLGKITLIFVPALCIPAFRKHEFCSFLDADRNSLATIYVDRRNRQLVHEAIGLIRQRAEITSDSYLPAPSPERPPVFEVVRYDLPYFVNKSVARFYDDRVIDLETSLVKEFVAETRYSELSGRTRIIKECLF
jgi:hypothetical protein